MFLGGWRNAQRRILIAVFHQRHSDSFIYLPTHSFTNPTKLKQRSLEVTGTEIYKWMNNLQLIPECGRFRPTSNFDRFRPKQISSQTDFVPFLTDFVLFLTGFVPF